MHTSERSEFMPPPAPGLLSSLTLALVAHALLLVALTWGVSWKRDAQTVSVQAELWAALPQEAAPLPPVVEAPPQPEPPPAPVQRVEPTLPSAADIALAREKERKRKEQQEREEQEKRALEKKKQLEQKKLAEAEKKKKKAQEAKLKAKEQAALAKKMREDQMKRMMGLAGEPSGNGSAERSAGPSAGYAGRIRARIKPNIVFIDNISGNPAAEVEVRTSPDGTIVGSKLIKSSGVKSWDEAVLKAIEKTEVLPRDIDGRVPSSMVIVFRPRD